MYHLHGFSFLSIIIYKSTVPVGASGAIGFAYFHYMCHGELLPLQNQRPTASKYGLLLRLRGVAIDSEQLSIYQPTVLCYWADPAWAQPQLHIVARICAFVRCLGSSLASAAMLVISNGEALQEFLTCITTHETINRL